VARRELIVLSICPGLRTGWALIGTGGELLGTGSLEALQVDRGLDWIIRRAHLAGRTVEVVTERMGPAGGEGHLAHQLEFVRRTILTQLEVFDLRAVDVAPSEVRGPAAEREWNGRALDWRQRAAVRLGRYYLVRRPQMRRRRAL
jgi:hypothetical protein